MSRHWIITAVMITLIAVGAAIAVLFTKGYTFSTKQGGILGTGIIAVTSTPTGASVYVDGHLTTATDTTIQSLSPKTYTIKITKEGFIPWEKKVEVKEGLVTDIKATLFPALPTLYPLTYNGATNPTISPDGQNLAFGVPAASESAATRTKAGVWIWTMSETPIAFARGAQPHQIVASTPSLDFSKATLKFSPDSKQVLVTLYENGIQDEAHLRNYLLNSTGGLTGPGDLRDITPTLVGTLKAWEEDQKNKDLARLSALKDLDARKVASESASKIQWAPDETKFMVVNSTVTPTPSTPKTTKISPSIAAPKATSATVYDLGTSDQQFIKAKKYDLPEALSYQWLPDSKHLILVQEGKISVVEFDGGNLSIVYAGNFDANTVFPWPDSSRLVFISTYNTPTGLQPNLYGINLK